MIEDAVERVVVVGAGIAGLATAHRLQSRGFEVTVLELDGRMGGIARTHETNGEPVGQLPRCTLRWDNTGTAPGDGLATLLDELGLDDAVDSYTGPTAIYTDGVVHPMNTRSQLLTYPGLRLSDKIRLGLFLRGVDVRGWQPSRDAYSDPAAFDDVGVETFLHEHTTADVCERFVRPQLEAAFGDRWNDVSAAWLLGARERRELVGPVSVSVLEGSVARLVDRLIESIGKETVVGGTRVTDLETENGRVSAVGLENPAIVTTRDADAVVVTDPAALSALSGYSFDIEFQGQIVSLLAMDEQLTGAYRLAVADDAPFDALIEHTNAVPRERYGGDHLLYAVRSVDTAESKGKQDDKRREQQFLDGIEELFPGFDRESVQWAKTARNRRITPVYEPGYLESVVPYGPRKIDGLYYAGVGTRAQYPVRSLDGAVRAGFECADRITTEH